MGQQEDKVLSSVLRPLAYWYEQENIEEVAINHPGDIWLRLRGKRAFPWVNHKDPKLTKEYLTNLLYIINLGWRNIFWNRAKGGKHRPGRDKGANT